MGGYFNPCSEEFCEKKKINIIVNLLAVKSYIELIDWNSLESTKKFSVYHIYGEENIIGDALLQDIGDFLGSFALISSGSDIEQVISVQKEFKGKYEKLYFTAYINDIPVDMSHFEKKEAISLTPPSVENIPEELKELEIDEVVLPYKIVKKLSEGERIFSDANNYIRIFLNKLHLLCKNPRHSSLGVEHRENFSYARINIKYRFTFERKGKVAKIIDVFPHP
ncbi:MAG: hypothetical protein NC824_02845 [Candidatus Omnitrophica bacterium]|nr:hypothetical protein [Candidatus Omnitrophota bacterium]